LGEVPIHYPFNLRTFQLSNFQPSNFFTKNATTSMVNRIPPPFIRRVNYVSNHYVVILRNEKTFKTNTRKARNTRNAHGRLLYPLVFFRLKKRNGEKSKGITQTQERHETQETHTLVRQGAFLPPFGPCFSLVFLTNEWTQKKQSLKYTAPEHLPETG